MIIEREVTQTKKDKDGDILALCNPIEGWSPRNTKDAINDIENTLIGYYTIIDFRKVDIHVAVRSGKKYLRTDPDHTLVNNLDNLPDCL